MPGVVQTAQIMRADLDRELQMQRSKAVAVLPAGFELVNAGQVQAGDQVWSFTVAEWVEVKSQVSVGRRPRTWEGADVAKLVAVVRRQAGGACQT